jgi:hypothetical protein
VIELVEELRPSNARYVTSPFADVAVDIAFFAQDCIVNCYFDFRCIVAIIDFSFKKEQFVFKAGWRTFEEKHCSR